MHDYIHYISFLFFYEIRFYTQIKNQFFTGKCGEKSLNSFKMYLNSYFGYLELYKRTLIQIYIVYI